MDKAWTWGKQTQNIRVNPIHGEEEEVKLVLSDTFEASEKNTEATDRSGSIFVQDLFFSRVHTACK